MTNIIFLDIDGPFLPGRSYFHPQNKKKPWSFWDPYAVAMVERVRKDADAFYVIASAWAVCRNQEEMKKIFSEQNISVQYFHEDWITPRKLSSHRAAEISWWLDNHPEISKWVAFDDDCKNIQFDQKHLLKGCVAEVDFEIGTTVAHYKVARETFELKEIY